MILDPVYGALNVIDDGLSRRDPESGTRRTLLPDVRLCRTNYGT